MSTRLDFTKSNWEKKTLNYAIKFEINYTHIFSIHIQITGDKLIRKIFISENT